jgi:hypothetical protein
MGVANTPLKHLALLWAAIAAFPLVARGQPPDDAVLRTAHFAFYSDLTTNAHDQLITVAVARRANQPVPLTTDEQACFDRLPVGSRMAWTRAVDDYIAASSTNLQRFYERMELAGLIRVDAVKDPADQQFLRQWRALLDSATPAYRQCRWPAQDALNRQWIGHVQELLAVYEGDLGNRLPEQFAAPWEGLPFRVDVVNVGSPLGANSASRGDPPTLHILASSTNRLNQGPAALETVFHEATHFLSLPSSPLAAALGKAAAAGGVTAPADFVHQVHFAITGEAVRRAFARQGVTYAPSLVALKLFSNEFRDAASRTIPAYLDGRRTLDQAAAELVAALAGRR